MTEEGFVCLALCGALNEFYHETIAASILHELARSLNAPRQFVPSLIQWKALLKSCAGVFTTSGFGVLAMDYAGKRPDGWLTYQTEQPRTACAMPKSIAKALIGIAKVSKGDLSRIMITGDNDIGFLAAFCQFFLGLSLLLYSHSIPSAQLPQH